VNKQSNISPGTELRQPSGLQFLPSIEPPFRSAAPSAQFRKPHPRFGPVE